MCGAKSVGICAILLVLVAMFFIVSTASAVDVPEFLGEDILRKIHDGDFGENAEHFWEKSQVRQTAMIVSLTALLGLTDDVLCENIITMHNGVQNKMAVVCDIRSQHLTNGHTHEELFDVGVMIFSLDEPLFLITIIPSQWRYPCSLTKKGYIIVSGPNPCLMVN